MSFDERYGVILSRDPRFDGQFVTAVSSTGIYCRPSCPARTPKPSNVSFFATSAAAHEAGYRACKRCLPEAAPGSPEWDLRGDTTARAMRLIADGVVEREGVPGLARRLGYSPRHLTRLLTAELGAGPLALSRAHRAHTARMLLVGTDLPAADVAFSAGFSSIRQFNETVREVFGMPPLELRARRRRALGGSLEARMRRARSTSSCRTAGRSMPMGCSPGWGPARSAASSRRPRPRSPARCVWPADRRGSSCASTRSGASACARASRISATCRRSSRGRAACSTWMPTRSRSTRLWRGTPSSPRSSPGSRASACPAPPTRTRCSSGPWSASRSRSARRARR